ncbi:hypothetical protein MsAc7_06450 [Methanolapillus millepedarum]|uniref:Uncharacterized protein n=1 Tax=Methanolapillus millepedarum TaxID=3028296 RepID=A0AA96V259_9EURY|nr:hypothetical protein MsAc7_06450 [Methanosarcinaceae archaeon Ac7]
MQDFMLRFDTDFKNVISFFEEISKIPRCSRHEEKVADYLEKTGAN